MSRLDSFIHRVTAQRACLNHAAGLIAGTAGPILELGLGNGRTYDHLRGLFPDRDIFVFDRQIAAHPACIPDAGHVFLGEFHATLPAARERLGGQAALAHCDIGSGDQAATADLAQWLGPVLDELLVRGAVIVSDQPLAARGWVSSPLPDGAMPGSYFFYRTAG